MTDPDPNSADPSAPTLERGISGNLLYVFVLGDVLRAGIYALVGVVAGEVGGAVCVPLPVALVPAMLTALPTPSG